MAEKEIAEMSNHPGPHLVVTLQTKNESGGGGGGWWGGGVIAIVLWDPYQAKLTMN